MSKGINLLGAEKQLSSKRGSKKIKLLRTIAVGLLFIVSGLSIVLFVLIALSPLPVLQKQEQDALGKLAQYHPDVAKLLLVKERLKASEMVLAKRSDFDQTLTKIKSNLPSNASIIGMTMKSDEISVTVSSNSLSALDTFLNNLISATEAKKDFSKVTLTKFFMSQDNSAFNLTINVVML